MPLRYLDESNYRDGMVRDVPSWLLPPGSVYDAQNVLFDSRGIARLRGGTDAIFSGAQTAYGSMLVYCYQTDSSILESLMAFDERNAIMYYVNTTTGVPVNVMSGLLGQVAQRAISHFGFGIFPQTTTSGTPFLAVTTAGQQTAGAFTATANIAMVAGNPTLTLSGGNVTTNIRVGSMFHGLTATTNWTGRVTAITGGSTFTVWPTPVETLTLTSGYTEGASQGSANAACAASFQNRLLYGNTRDWAGVYCGRRVYYSPLPTEQTGIVGFGAFQNSGANFIDYYMYPSFNWFEIPGADPIVAMEPVSDNELLILTRTGATMFRGNLITQLSTTSPTITFDLSKLEGTSGCLSDKSVQRTNKGIVWAGAEGIYLYEGSGRIVDLTKDKINGYWKALLGTGPSVVGSTYARGTYVVWIIPGGAGGIVGIAIDLRGNEPRFSRFLNGEVFYTAPRPSRPEQVFGLRWWATGSANPSMTNGQLVRVDPMFDPYTALTTNVDSDGTAIAFSVTTRVLAGDSATQKMMQRGSLRYQAAMPAASVSVTAQSKIDAGDIVAASVRTLGTLSNTEARTINNATNATPIVCTTTAVHGLQDEDYVDISGVTGNLNANGRWRVDVLSTTTFALMGSTGSGAYGSGGSVKKVTESDFLMTTLDEGQGVSFTVASTGAVNNFELHGIRIAMFESAPVMSS